MKKASALLILLALVLTACAGLLPAATPEPPGQYDPAEYSSPPEIEVRVADSEPPDLPEQEESEQAALTWLVEPQFEYESITFCSMCGFFTRPGFRLLDVFTGEDVRYKEGHGGVITRLLYDETLGLFGLLHGHIGLELDFFAEAEFLATYPQLTDTLNMFYKVDSTRITYTNGVELPRYYDLSEALTGKVAVAVGTDFVTGFDFDQGEWHPWQPAPRGLYDADGFAIRSVPSTSRVMAVRQGEHWGVIDSGGNVLAPFVFEHTITIDDYAAFAMYGGLYGILQLREGRPEASPAPADLLAAPAMAGNFDTAIAQFGEGEIVWVDAWSGQSENMHLLDTWIENYRMSVPGRVAILEYGGPFPSRLFMLESDGSATYTITEYFSAGRWWMDEDEQGPPQVYRSSVVVRRYYDYIFGHDFLEWYEGSQHRQFGPVRIPRHPFYWQGERLEWDPADGSWDWDAAGGHGPQLGRAESRVEEMYRLSGLNEPVAGWYPLSHFRTVGIMRMGNNVYYVVYGHHDLDALIRGEHGGSVTAVSLDFRFVFRQSMAHGEWIFVDDAQREFITP